MSSGFVSGGTTDPPFERSDEWLAAQEELEANRRRKAEEGRQNNGRSLYETLEANKGTLLKSTISPCTPTMPTAEKPV
jgi:hypothetical protein